MVINHNLSSMNAQRNMKINNDLAAKAMEKLSSGLKINRAGDNAAGLSISEKMRAQIRGLNQAAANAEDGISLIQTAEGALNETHSILQRMRELSNQAANGTNADNDKKAIQEEMNQLTSEVNRIAHTTQFNTKNLLDGSVGNRAQKETVLKGLNTWWLKEGSKLVKDSTGLEFSSGTKLKVVLEDSMPADKANTLAYAQNSGDPTKIELHVNMAQFKSLKKDDVNGTGGNQYLDRVIAHELTHAAMFNQFDFTQMSNLPAWFVEGSAEAVHGGDGRLRGDLSNGQTISSLIDKIGTEKTANGSADYSAGYLALRYLDKTLNTNATEKVIDYLKTNHNKGLDDALNSLGDSNIKSIATLKSSMENALNAVGGDKDRFLSSIGINLTNADTGALTGADANAGASELTADSVVPEIGDFGPLPTASSTIGNLSVEWPELKGGDGLVLQIGANEGQSFTITIDDMSASGLGITSNSGGEGFSSSKNVTDGTNNENVEYALDVTTYDNAKAAMTKLDDAIKKVSTQRSSLGAYQNRLEHTINNLQTSSENLISAESRIRDTDMAEAMSEYSKRNILQQAAQAMLAQAKSAPQSVLQLLQ